MQFALTLIEVEWIFASINIEYFFDYQNWHHMVYYLVLSTFKACIDVFHFFMFPFGRFTTLSA